MKIVHICLYGTYSDNFSYQENIIPRYHAAMGHEVTILAQNLEFDYSGKKIKTNESCYTDNYGVNIRRYGYKRYPLKKMSIVFFYMPILDALRELEPDLIFVHDAQLTTISYFDILKYKKKYNKNCIVLGDIHADYYNSGLMNKKKCNIVRKIILDAYMCLFRYRIHPIYEKIYYIAQSCYIYAKEYYKIPESKLDLLPLGYDDKLLESKNSELIRAKVRSKYKIDNNDIVIVHGGKLDEKKKTKELIEAIAQINNHHIKMFLFGGIADDYKRYIEPLIEKFSKWIFYLGPLTPSEYYDIYLSSDIAVFPGGQSAIWQEAIGCRLPIVVYYRDGMTQYLNRCGNADFFMSQDTEEIKNRMESILVEGKIVDMKDAAIQASEFFSYKNSSERIIEDFQKYKTESTEGKK